jgi:YegS/Rv2252/BmrU family lipid kinase
MTAASVNIVANGHAKGMVEPEERDAFRAEVAQRLPGANILFTDASTDVTETARQAVRDGARVVVAGGGDGTCNAVANALLGTEATLGVIPLGTLNHFAQDLGIPVTIPEALDCLAAGHTRTIDVGKVNERAFVNNSGLGLYPDIVFNREERQRKGASKWPAAFSEGLRAFLRYKLLTLRVDVDGRKLIRRTPAVFVGNNEYIMEGVIAAKRTTLSGGVLSLYIPHPSARLGLLWFSIRALFGSPKNDADFDKVIACDFTIETKMSRLRVSIDGEVTTMQTPLKYQSLPGALRVIAPAVTPATSA